MSLGDSLGVGPNWQPGPTSFGVAKIDLDPEPMYVIRFNTAVGVIAVPFTREGFESLVAEMQSALSGLVMPPAPSLVKPQ